MQTNQQKEYVIRTWIGRNKRFLGSLDKTCRLALFCLLGLQIVFYLYYLLTIPVNYDEWHSFNFSGDSFWAVISYYPAPNNHIFYNIISRLFVITGLDREVAIRLPSLFASVLASYYFFKICRGLFTPLLSIVLLTYLVTLNYSVWHAFLGRGYAFLNLFCVLAFYASARLSENYADKRYRILFILVQFFGMYTVPSFLYASATIYLVLGISVILKKDLKQFLLFCLDGLVCVALVAGAYAIVVYNNNPDNLLKPNNGDGSFSMKDPEAFGKIFFYLKTRFVELFRSENLLLLSMLVFITFVYELIKRKGRPKYLVFLSVLMFFSPFFILVIHQVFPFGRNWLYLCIPLTLCLGFIIRAVSENLPFVALWNKLPVLKPVFYLSVVIICAVQLALFGPDHRKNVAWDYNIDYFRRHKLNAVVKRVRTIGTTESGVEFYPKDMLFMICRKNNPGEQIICSRVDENLGQDLLIINGEELDKYRKALLRYDFAYEYQNYWFYLKR